MTKIGIISDTHDNVPNILKAVKKFLEHKADFVIHAGDICAPVTVKYFKDLKMKFIFGNCDGDREMIKKITEEIGGELYGDKMELEVEGKKILVIHKPRYEEYLGKYDYIIHGHIHKMVDEKKDGSRILCPAGHYLGNPGPNYIIILDPETDSVEFIQI